jgi:hypothetical protein
MRGRWIFRILKFAAFLAVAFLVFGFVVTRLWNFVMPPLFGFHLITFWQAVALVILGKLLFGGFRPRPRRHVLGRAHEGTLGTDDARAARKIPRRHARWLRAVPAPSSRRAKAVMRQPFHCVNTGSLDCRV